MRAVSRRDFLKASAVLATSPSAFAASRAEPLFKISLAQWSLHKAFFAKKDDPKRLDPLNFAKIAKDDYGIDAVTTALTF